MSGTATVLFTDLVGSTELMAHFGDTAFDRLRAEHFARLREALSACCGQEVKNTGDGLLATFTSTVDALAAGVAAQQATHRHARSAELPLAIRVGVSLGEIAFEDGDVFGTPVVEAARLVAVAQPGQILVTSIVRVVAGSRAGVEFTDLGPLELKGLPEPVPVCAVAWEPLAVAPALPLPSFLTRIGQIFVGRDEDLRRLIQAWKEASAGERRVALLAGEPGIGKTRIAVELAHIVYAEGTTVLAGRCDEDMGVPYQPFVEALRHYVAHAPEPQLGRHSGELARLVPELTDAVPDLAAPLRSDPETERYRLFDAVASWLADVSVATPVLLVLDDLHWAAKPTLLLLRHILRFPESLRVLAVATYRDSEVGRGHPLSEVLADLRRVEGVERFPLTGLDRAAVAAFIEAVAGRALIEEDETLARAVWAETEGNPFFVAEVLHHLTETGVVHYQDERWVTTTPVKELGIPEGVRDVIGRRLSRLSEPTNRALAVASVVGLEFEPAVVQAAGDIGEGSLLEALEESRAARLLSEVPGPTPSYRFAHALLRATLYEELTVARRVALHRRVAQAIEILHTDALNDYLPALAHHWARVSAPAEEGGRAVDYAARAGDRALVQLAHDEAIAYYRQALELLELTTGPPSHAQRLDLLIALGQAERLAGDPAHRETLLTAAHLAKELGNVDALVRAALANRRGFWPTVVGSVDAERLAALQAALDAVGPADCAIRAGLLAALGQELLYAGDRERRVRLSDEALALARRLGDPATLVQVLLVRFFTVVSPDTMEACATEAAELLELVKHLGDPAVEAQASILRFRTLMEAGDLEEADDCLDNAERLAVELAQPTLRWITGMYRASRTLLAGDLEAAEGVLLVAAELGADAEAFLPLQFVLQFERGRLDELEGRLAEAAAASPGFPLLQAVRALLYCELDRPEVAQGPYDKLARANFAGVEFDSLHLLTLTHCAATCVYLGDTSRAAVLHDMLAPYGDRVVAIAAGVSGAVAHYLGMLGTTLGRFGEAETRFSRAAAIHECIGAVTWLARTRLEWARMLLARRQPGDPERAGELLGQVLATARHLGLANVERRVVALLGEPSAAAGAPGFDVGDTVHRPDTSPLDDFQSRGV